MPKQKRHWILRPFLAIGSFVFYILSFPFVRNWIWDRVMNKGKEKVIDAKAKIVKK